LLLAIFNTTILGSESHGNHYHTLMPEGSRSLQISNSLETLSTFKSFIFMSPANQATDYDKNYYNFEEIHFQGYNIGQSFKINRLLEERVAGNNRRFSCFVLV
jgi:hypothetical protein